MAGNRGRYRKVDYTLARRKKNPMHSPRREISVIESRYFLPFALVCSSAIFHVRRGSYPPLPGFTCKIATFARSGIVGSFGEILRSKLCHLLPPSMHLSREARFQYPQCVDSTNTDAFYSKQLVDLGSPPLDFLQKGFFRQRDQRIMYTSLPVSWSPFLPGAVLSFRPQCIFFFRSDPFPVD